MLRGVCLEGVVGGSMSGWLCIEACARVCVCVCMGPHVLRCVLSNIRCKMQCVQSAWGCVTHV